VVRNSKSYSLVIIFILLVNLFTPITQVFAADIQSPTGFSYSVSNGNDVKLRWNLISGASKYNIYINENGTRTLIGSTKSNTYTITNVPEGFHNYEVVSYGEGIGESTTPSTLSVKLIYPVIQAPQGLTASVKNGNDLDLNWKPSAYATAYNIYQVINGETELVDTVSTKYISVNTK
jgi:fibronectin type 3 domain-containing protein